MSTATFPTLIQSAWPARRETSLVRPAVLVVLGSLALALSAHVKVPFYPVPMTMQTLVVLVIGATFGLRLGLATIGLYLLEGLMGLPVFTSGAGPAYMMGPTGGYLAGFVAAVALMGWGAERGYDRSPLAALALMSLGHVVILALGFAWLTVLFGASKAWAVGVAPFYVATVAKTVLAAGLSVALWGLIEKFRR